MRFVQKSSILSADHLQIVHRLVRAGTEQIVRHHFDLHPKIKSFLLFTNCTYLMEVQT